MNYSTSNNKFQTAYVPTHLRFSSWLVGVIAGYIFLKYQNRTIRIPRVSYLFEYCFYLFICIDFIRFLFTVIEFICLGTVIVGDGNGDIY